MRMQGRLLLFSLKNSVNTNAMYFFKIGNTGRTDAEGKEPGFEYDEIWTWQAASS